MQIEHDEPLSLPFGRLWPIVIGLVLIAGGIWFIFFRLPIGSEASSEGISSEPAPVAGSPAPDFVLKNLDGETIRLSDFKGKPVIVNFWATWCGPCRNEMPVFQRAFEAHKKDDLVILAINFEEGEDLVRPFIGELGITFEVLYDTQAEATKTYQVTGLPRTLFISREGVIQHIQVGEVKEEMLAGFLEHVL